jgi:hypothetical protein
MAVNPGYRDRAPYVFSRIVKKVVFDLVPVTRDAIRALHEVARDGAAAGANGRMAI